MKRLVFLAILAGTVLTAAGGFTFYHASTEGGKCVATDGALAALELTRPPRDLPEIRFVDGNGEERSLADYRGQGLVLNFWATWCAPCVREMPALDRLHAELQGAGVAVLALSADRGGGDVVERFYQKHEIENLKTLLDKNLATARTLDVRGLPTTLLIDSEGKEIGRLVGAVEWDAPDAVDLLRDCLGGKKT